MSERASGADGYLSEKGLIPMNAKSTQVKELAIKTVLIASSMVAIFTTIGIVLSLSFEAFRFFAKIPITDFIFGLEWSPQTAIRSDQVGASGKFGVIPLLTGTLLISAIAMSVATPLGLYSAVYLSEYASQKTRNSVKPLLELLAGIPTVVYGFFAALVLRDASLGMGATQAETIKNVVLPAATPGIMGSLLLAISRAIGETMIVVMAAGLAANLTINPFEAVTTMTVQIVTLLTGDQEFDSAKTLAAFAIALFLLVLTLGLNVIALKIVDRYKAKYA